MRNWIGGLLGLYALAASAPAALAGAEQTNGLSPCPADKALSSLVAASDLILVGRPAVARERLLASAEQQSPEFLDIPVAASRTLKGSVPSQRAVLKFYPKDAWYKPSNAALLERSDAPSVLFLIQLDTEPGGLFFAGSTPEALQPATADAVDAVAAEVARQDRVLRGWRPDPSVPHYREVRGLVARLGRVGGRAQERVFERLEALGADAVPAIVAHMDDRRHLRDPRISLRNQATDAFEAYRHYGPERVVDALAAILSQVAGQSFGEIEHGGSERERRAAVAGWRVYAADLRCAAPSGGK